MPEPAPALPAGEAPVIVDEPAPPAPAPTATPAAAAAASRAVADRLPGMFRSRGQLPERDVDAGPAPLAADPVVTGVGPAAGTTDGGTRVTVTGVDFAGAVEVHFDGIPGTGLVVVSDTELQVTTPPVAEEGTANVRVFTAAGGRSPGNSPVDFRYAHTPVLTAISPTTGSDAGGTLVSISGTELDGTTEVLFGGLPATVVTVAPDRVRVVAPDGPAAGPVDVRVATLGGTSAVVPVGAFTFAATPKVASVSPASGSPDGGTAVTLEGANFTGATRVTFGGVEGTDLEVVSDDELRVTTPARTTLGDVEVVVTTVAGRSTGTEEPAEFGYVASPTPVAQSLHGYWPLGLIGALSWTVWFVRRWLSRHRYRPVVNDFRTTTSVVIPVYQEDPEVLERCLRTWLREDPTEVILVVDDRDDELLRRLHSWPDPRVQVLEWHHTGKRGALGAGVRRATGEVVVFADSDTEWRPGLLAAMQMPFADPEVGGVGSRQHVYLPHTNVWRRVAYWMLNTRYLDYVPAMSRQGGVACLSGRTAAYRRAAIAPVTPGLEREMFLGRQCVAGDDGRLTWLVLAAGYKTVHQDTAQADSMFPADLRAFVRQRIRWSRNSYRCYLTALSQGWLWRQPLITQVTVLQILLTPVSMGATVWYGSRWILDGGWIALAIVGGWAVVGRALRAMSHLQENPREIVLAPLAALTIAVIALPIKTWAALTMNKQGWLTRQEGQRVQGQAEIVPAAVGEGQYAQG